MNPFDQFDNAAKPAANPFDQFDTAPQPQVDYFPQQTGLKQNSGVVGNLGTSLKRGVEQIPGALTGFADMALNLSPVAYAADKLGSPIGRPVDAAVR